MHTVIACVDHLRPTPIPAGWDPATIANDNVAFPGTAVIAAETDQRFAVQVGILDGQQAATDGVQSHIAQGTAADHIGTGDPHMRVHARERTVLQQDVLAEVRPDHTPARTIVNVVHPTVDHAEINHIAGAIVVRSHADRLARRSDG